MRGYRAAREEREDEAIRRLDGAYGATGIPPFLIWLVDVLVRADRPEDALRAMEPLHPDPLIGLFAGRLYERVGQREKAIEAYGWVVEAWAGADPVFRPAHEDALQAIARLRQIDRG